MMKYYSTRNKAAVVSAAEAIAQGLSVEGGLFVPQTFPHLSCKDISDLASYNYQQRAVKVLSMFLTDFSKEEITDCVKSAYNEKRFQSKDIAPLKKLTNKAYILELWHGPTCAFKDMALQILPKFLTYSVKKVGEERTVVILVATSGDTGKAALEGFADVDGTRIIVFYPNNGVSNIQKLQMTTQRGNNICVGAVNGNFDDAQNGVKEIFTDDSYKKELANSGFVFSSANSINWGRLVPQVVYYISAYCDMVKNGDIICGDEINVCVPTGNFGNILAAYYARKMGVPISKLICASNCNNVLTDFIETGIYNKNRDFHTTISPSMDILISSNLERLLFDVENRNDEKISKYMGELKEKGYYKVDEDCKKQIDDIFYGGFCDDERTKKKIKNIHDRFSYVCDTHTAVAVSVYEEYVKKTNDVRPTVIVSTASPFKFNNSVLSAILGDSFIQNKDDFELLNVCSQVSGFSIPNSLLELKQLPVRFDEVCERNKMREFVDGFLKNK